MIGQSITESTRTAALDGALSFSILVDNQRELTLGSAQSSVSGLLTAIKSSPGDYANLLTAAQEAIKTQTESGKQLREPTWTSASGGVKSDLENAFQQALEGQTTAARTEATAAASAAAAAKNAATNPSAEYTYAATAEEAANALLDALTKLENNDDAGAAASLAEARTKANAALSQATALLVTLNGENPLPTARIAATQATIDAANATLAAADKVEAVTGSALAAAAGENPSSTELTSSNPPLYLTTWGDSGTVSLTDANGVGILIRHDGTVDTTPPSGNGWSFQTDSTFLLSDGTKISIKPGTPASILATRGQQMVEITGLELGRTPTTTRKTEGGVDADKAWNDGHIFEMGPNATQWTLSGLPLGDLPGVREDVAFTLLVNERVVDVTLVNLTAGLSTLLQQLGLKAEDFDTDKDGKFSLREMADLVDALNAVISSVQTQFDAALKNTGLALESLQRLNRFLEKMMAEADDRQSSRKEISAEERDQLQRIQKELNEARRALRVDQAAQPTAFTGGEVVAAAKIVLNQVQSLSEEPPPIEKPGTPESAPPPKSELATGDAPETGAVSPAFRRAERLLSGILGPAARATTLFGESAKLAAPEVPEQETLPQSLDLQLPSKQVGEPTLSTAESPLPVVDEPKGRSTPNWTGIEPPFSTNTPPVPNTSVTEANVQPGSDTARAIAAASKPAVSDPVPYPSSLPSLQTPNTTSETKPVSVSSLRPSTPKSTGENDLPATQPGSTQIPKEEPRPLGVSSQTSTPADNPLKAPAASVGGASRPGASGPVDRTHVGDREAQRHLDQFRQIHSSQLDRARTMQSSVRETVERFLTLVGQDAELSKVFKADDLSDDQRADLRGKITELEKATGLTWGTDPAETPQGEVNLAARALRSGLMI